MDDAKATIFLCKAQRGSAMNMVFSGLVVMGLSAETKKRIDDFLLDLKHLTLDYERREKPK